MAVLDANFLVALVSSDPRGKLILGLLSGWLDDAIDLDSPILSQYEYDAAYIALAESLYTEL
jgi:predicted nucleic acid-binding protein